MTTSWTLAIRRQAGRLLPGRRAARPMAFFLSAASTALCLGQDADPKTPAPARLALLVGIDRYQQPDQGEWKRLHGCENDVELVRELLKTRFGFRDQEIRTLRSEEATHERIVRTFHEHLIQQAQPDTQVVFWFSGHGSQILDRSQLDLAPTEDFEPGKDQTMLAHDSRKGSRNGSFDVTDDEMFTLLSALRSQSVLYVTDCCHSGGLLRGDAELSARRVEDGEEEADSDLLTSFWPEGLQIREDDAEGAMPMNVVHVAACCSKQEAGEHKAPGGKVHGTLTFCLVQALQECRTDASWQEVVEIVRAKIGGTLGTRPNQTVQAHGAVLGAVFGGQGRALPGGYRVERERKDTLRIAAGRIHGLSPKTRLDLIDIQGEIRATAIVDEVHTAHSMASLHKSTLPDGVALWARPQALHGLSPLLVALGEGVERDALADIPFAAVAAAKDADCQLARRESGLELCDRSGRPIRVHGAESLRDQLWREHRYQTMVEMAGQRGMWSTRVQARVPTDDQLNSVGKDGKKTRLPRAIFDAQTRADWIEVTAPPQQDDDGGAVLVLELANDSDEDLHFAVLSLQEDRAIRILFGRNANNVVRAGSKRQVRIRVGPPTDWPADQPIQDRILLLATARHVDWSDLEQGHESPATRGDEQSTSVFLRLQGEATRGDDQPQPWGISFLDLRIRRP